MLLRLYFGLTRKCPLLNPHNQMKTSENFETLGRFRDEDGTEKFVFRAANGGIIELTWVKNNEDADVFCLPTHHYCNLGCKFCHLTAENGSGIEMKPISGETLFPILAEIAATYTTKPKTLLSFMGVGEPFLNINLVLASQPYFQTALNRNTGLAFASMFLSPEPMPTIADRVVAEKIPLRIHFSMHSPLDSVRQSIIPRARASINECLTALAGYRDRVLQHPEIMAAQSEFHGHDHVAEIHYTLIDGVNDSDEELSTLIALGKRFALPIKFLRFNPIGELRRSPREETWLTTLQSEYGARVWTYAPPGPNIGSSCGQFTKHYYRGDLSPADQRNFEEWKAKYEIPFD